MRQEDSHLGRAAALAWILSIIILVIGLINLFITKHLVRDEGGRGVVHPAAPRRDAAGRKISHSWLIGETASFGASTLAEITTAMERVYREVHSDVAN